jgi:hypothetical protein
LQKFGNYNPEGSLVWVLTELKEIKKKVFNSISKCLKNDLSMINDTNGIKQVVITVIMLI